MSECKRIPDDFFENEPGVVTCVGRWSQTWEDCFDAETMGLARIMARTMLSAMHRGRPLRTLPALLVLAVSGTTAGADTAVMRPPRAGAERIMDAKQVMRLAAVVRSTGYACQEGIFVAYKLPREADAQRFDVMCLGTGALSDRRMRHYILQIQDDASLALESTP